MEENLLKSSPEGGEPLNKKEELRRLALEEVAGVYDSQREYYFHRNEYQTGIKDKVGRLIGHANDVSPKNPSYREIQSSLEPANKVKSTVARHANVNQSTSLPPNTRGQIEAILNNLEGSEDPESDVEKMIAFFDTLLDAEGEINNSCQETRGPIQALCFQIKSDAFRLISQDVGNDEVGKHASLASSLYDVAESGNNKLTGIEKDIAGANIQRKSRFAHRVTDLAGLIASPDTASSV